MGAEAITVEPTMDLMQEQALESEVLANNSLSIKERVLHSRAGRAAVTFVTALGIGGAAEMAVTSAEAYAAEPVAHVASHTWSVLGGDPLVKGGVHSRAGLRALFHSSKGKSVMRGEGLSGSDIRVIEKAVDNNRETNCTLNTGDHFRAMGFGQFGEVENDVTYTAGSAPAYCLDVRNGNKEIQLKIPKKCANIALAKEVTRRPSKHHQPVPITGGKVFKDAQGDVISPFPTGIVEEDLSCTVNNKQKTYPEVVMNAPTEPLGKCDVGTQATVSETVIVNPDNWVSESGSSLSFKVASKGNKITFINREKPITPPSTPPTIVITPPPPTPPVTPPPAKPFISGNFVPPMHVHQGDEANLCVGDIQVSNNDPVIEEFGVTDSNGNLVGQQDGYEFTQPDGSVCVRWDFPNAVENVEAYVELVDTNNPDNSVTYSDNVPVEPTQF